MDGTLLDHHTYSTADAAAQIERLADAKIPLIFNTSKSRSEVLKLREQLNNSDPFVVENGSAIIIPVSSPLTDALEDVNHSLDSDYVTVVLGKGRAVILDSIQNLLKEYSEVCRGFSQMSSPQIAEITGLAVDDAAMAADREYSEPIHWYGNNKQKQQFIASIKTLGFTVLEGGRFIHVLGSTDKGKATTYLKNHYTTHYGETCFTLASGDGKNDIDMLEAADLAIIVRSPVNPPPIVKNPNQVTSRSVGPKGWAECIKKTIL